MILHPAKRALCVLGQVVTFDVIGGEQLIEWRLPEPRSYFGNQAKGYGLADTHVVESAGAREGKGVILGI